MTDPIRVLYLSGSTAGARSPPLADHTGFDVTTADSVTEGCDRLSTDTPACVVATPAAIADADDAAIRTLWNATPECPCLLAPPPSEPPVVGDGAPTMADTAADPTTADHTPSLAARIRTAVGAPATTDANPEHYGDNRATDDSAPTADTAEPAYRSLIEDGLAISSVGTFVLDSDFSVVWLNDGIEEYFGVDRESVLGRDKRRLINDRLKHIFAESERFAETVCATYDDNTYVEQFTCHVVGDDSRDDRWLEHSSYPIQDGPYAGGRIEHYVDITEQRETHQQLEAQNERLAEFASIASHDLRNPLHVMGSSLELAAETGEAEHFERAERAVDRMEQLIDDLLVLAQQGEGIDTVEPVDLDDIARECWGNLSTAEATLRVEADRTIMADRSRLSQLLENLFSNSIDHAGTGVTITVDACDGGFVVVDDGPGVPPDDRENIFKRGYTTTREGTGLGLYIVSEIAAAHGWDVAIAEGAESTDSAENGARIEITGVDDAAGS
ncbi:receiver/sensor box histidine kinase [Halonotius roseus]|uniref:histidine kinase n=1 Tax=Halonotius roseus TaxID=2511997 RepID=A0A544QQ11_9EURY|nr:ATP-binding protein [Halonotius roseus]TQQ81506.1 PAS domain-containing protein [Halonotius roseus]